jgi:hypothetical protein
VAQDVALRHLHDRPVQQVQVAAADGGARYLEDDVCVLDDYGFCDLGWI